MYRVLVAIHRRQGRDEAVPTDIVKQNYRVLIRAMCYTKMGYGEHEHGHDEVPYNSLQ